MLRVLQTQIVAVLYSLSGDSAAALVPGPGTIILLGTGLAGLAGSRRKKG
jgi:hypothetical protein